MVRWSVQVSCGLLVLLASRWFVVVWELRAIVPLPLFYGIGMLPILTLGGAMLPMIHDSGGGRCLCGWRARQIFSVLCATLDVVLSLGLAGSLVNIADKLATEPDQRLNIYWSGTLHVFIYVLMASILGAFPSIPCSSSRSVAGLTATRVRQHFCCTQPSRCRDTAARSIEPPCTPHAPSSSTLWLLRTEATICGKA